MLGLHRRRGDVVDMTACTLLDPTLLALLPPLRTMLHSLPAVHAGVTYRSTCLTAALTC
ncbi:hypothetical protein RAA17_19600 [Komagataeibacter rhaeticus]|nr:hypothetical protein [Komagataeibacter rhaeticus]